MAFTRKFLSAMGIEADKVDQIIDAHTEVTDALKSERDQYKVDAEKLPGVQAELNGLKAAKEKDGKDPYKVKYEAIKEEFENYKKDQTAKETAAAKADAYKALLKECGVSEKRIEAILKVTDLDGVELDDKGKIADAATQKKAIQAEWSDFISTESTKGAQTATPPASTGGRKTVDEIMAIQDDGERQRAIAENHDLFGF